MASVSIGKSCRTRDYYNQYQVLEYLQSFIPPVLLLLYNKVTVAVLYDGLASLSNQESVSRFFLPIKRTFHEEELELFWPSRGQDWTIPFRFRLA